MLTVVAAAVVLVGVAASSLSELTRSVEESEWVAHTREVLETLSEASLRSQALRQPTGDRLWVDPAKVDAIGDSVRVLRDATKDNPAQRTRIEHLEAALVRLRASPSTADTDALVATLAAMKEDERVLLAERRARARGATERARWFVLAGNAVAFALVGYSLWLSRREALGHEKAQAEAEARRKEAELRKVEADAQKREAEERKVEAEARKVEAEERKREADELYNRAPCGYHVSRNPDMVYERVNDTELAWLGYTREELVGKRRFFDFLTAESQAKVSAISQADREAALGTVELDVVRRDGTSFTVSVAASAARDANGKVTGWMTTIFDVDAQKKAAEETERLRRELEARAASLQTVNKDLEAFSYSISHDLRAPLRAIGGFARILEEDHSDVLGPEGRRVLGVVRANTSRMSQLVDDLLAFSRLGRKSVSRSNVDMKRLAEDVVAELKDQNGSLGADVVIDDLPRAHADPGLVRQVLVNLVSNAVKYSSQKPEPKVHVSATAEDGEAVYHVKDNGAGFDMQGYDKLFGVFQRLHRHEEFPGTGVGLAIAHRVVAKHGGRIWAASKVGEGAEFHFTLPKESA